MDQQISKSPLSGLNVAYVGDTNNVANSLMLGALKVGANFCIACPPSYGPTDSLMYAAAACVQESGARFRVVHDPIVAVQHADVVYTDTWVSMGQEHEQATRKVLFTPYQVNSTTVSYAKPDAIVMHCQPAHRGVEITGEVLDSLNSVVLDQAENRLHVQKAVLTLILD